MQTETTSLPGARQFRSTKKKKSVNVFYGYIDILWIESAGFRGPECSSWIDSEGKICVQLSDMRPSLVIRCGEGCNKVVKK